MMGRPFWCAVLWLLLATPVLADSDLDKAADAACDCLAEPYAQAGRLLAVWAVSGGDGRSLLESEGEVKAVAERAGRCFESLAARFPTVARSAELQGQVMRRTEQRCPSPFGSLFSVFDPQVPF